MRAPICDAVYVSAQYTHRVLLYLHAQTHASFRVKYFMEFGGNCVTADYKRMAKNKNVLVVRCA